jgi:hypothetical protein
MKRILLFPVFFLCWQPIFTQTWQPIQAGDGRFTHILFEQEKASLESRATGTYYLDYVNYDKNFLGNTINNGVYGNLPFTKTDTGYGGIPFVAEYYDSLVLSTNLTNWTALSWQNVVNLTIDSVFVRLNVDNMSGTNDELKMKIVDPIVTPNVNGNWLDFNITTLWQDSLLTSSDIGVHGGGSISFANVGFAVGLQVTGPFGLMFEFSGNLQDTCRLVWSYPTDGVACTNGSVSAPNKTPKKWDLYPTSFYNICTGGIGLNQLVSLAFPHITGTGGYAYYVDCSNPSTPYISDNSSNPFDPNKNQFQHWNMWALVTVTDNIGIEEQTEKGIRVFAYPNPANEFLQVNFTLPHPVQHTSVAIRDIGGRLITQNPYGSFPSGKNTLQIPLALPAGIYTYTIETDGVSLTRKFIAGAGN